MLDFITVGGIAGVIVLVLAACYAMYKYLSRESTYEEAFPNEAMRLLTSQQNADKNKPKNKRHHPKRKHSPKANVQKSQKQEEIQEEDEVDVDLKEKEESTEQTTDEQQSTAVPVPVESNEQEPIVDTAPSNINIKMKNKSKKKSNKAQFRRSSTATVEEEAKLVHAEVQQAAEDEPNNVLVNENADNKIEQNTAVATPMQNGSNFDAAVLQQSSQLANKKQKSEKDFVLPKALDRLLKDFGEIEPRILEYLQATLDENKAKENKLRGEIKEGKSEKTELEKKLKQMADDLERIRNENMHLNKQNEEINNRHLIYEQTVRNKLIETHKLKEENKQYVEINAQLNSKLSQMDQLNQKLSIMHAEMLKAQEERKMAKEYAEKVTNEMKKAQEDVRNIQTKAQDEVRNIQSKAQEEVHNMQVKYSGQNQAMQMELNKERELRANLENECMIAKQRMEKLANEAAVKEGQLREMEQYKSAYDSKLQALQNDLNREKDTKLAWQNAESQLNEMSGELENAMTSYQQIKAQLTSESGKVQEMMTANKELLAENSRLQEKAQNQSQNSLAELDELKATVAELNNQLTTQRARTNEQREINYKLMETVKQLQSAPENLVNGMAATNGSLHGNPKEMNNAELEAANQQIEKLIAENKQYMAALDSVNNQLLEVSRIAKEMELEKDTKIAKIEAKLTKLLEDES